MIKLERKFVDQVKGCVSKEELYPLLQNAVVLEHATIPPYLTAMFSLKPGTNEAIRGLIHSIVIQEMSHMTIAGNLLVAIGGSPRINVPGFIPKYPGKLPMGIGGDDFVVPIKRFSKDLVKDVFMVIEEPEDPVPIRAARAVEEEYATIGEFYEALKKKIEELGNGIFVVGPERQVLKWFDPSHVFPITGVKSAGKGIDVIVVEGEGTSTDPFEWCDDPAHFYKFSEIYRGRKIVKTDDGYAYDGDPIPFDEAGVYPMVDNPKIDDFPVGSAARILTERYAYSYSSLLNALHVAFNGQPDRIDAAIGLMYELKLQAIDLMSTVVNGQGQTAGPSYEYRNTQGGVSAAP